MLKSITNFVYISIFLGASLYIGKPLVDTLGGTLMFSAKLAGCAVTAGRYCKFDKEPSSAEYTLPDPAVDPAVETTP